MLFSEIILEDEKLEILRDNEFNKMGLVIEKYNDKQRVLSYVADERYIKHALENKNIVSIVCPHNIAKQLENKFWGGICVSEDARSTFFKIHNCLFKNTEFYRKNMNNVIAPTAQIHSTAIIENNNIYIGENTIIGPYAIIKENSHINNNVIIGERCIVGAPGFYYYGEGDNKRLVNSAGGVTIEDNVELHPTVTVECGIFGEDTFIGRNVKIDNHVLIGHDSIINSNSSIAAGCTLAGYVTIGKNTFLGVGVDAVPMVTIGNNVLVSAGAVVSKDIPDNSHYSGNFAVEHEKLIKHLKKILE